MTARKHQQWFNDIKQAEETNTFSPPSYEYKEKENHLISVESDRGVMGTN
jgi:hypothetical protein